MDVHTVPGQSSPLTPTLTWWYEITPIACSVPVFQIFVDGALYATWTTTLSVNSIQTVSFLYLNVSYLDVWCPFTAALRP